ncbi:hypothetical protein FXO37_01923 [Capsicum annuum]|nr:hypothetical protein FXO37_01923 [Capsicum annuum]
MDDCPSFSLGLTQLDTNSKVEFFPVVFDYEEPNFDENRSKYHNDPNKMKEIKKVVAEKSKKIIEESSRKFKKDDTTHPRLPKVDSVIAERVGNVIPRIFNWKVVGIKVKYEKFMGETDIGRSGKRPVVDIQSQSDHDIQGFEDFSTLPPTEILKKTGLLSDASASQHTKRHRTVYFDSTTVEEQFYQKTPSSVSTRTVSTQKIPSSGLKRVHAEKTTPSSSSKVGEESKIQAEKGGLKIVGETVKSVDIDSVDDPMDGHYFDWNRIPIQEQSENVEGCCEDIATVRLDALVKFVVNQNSANPNVGTPSTVHINKDHMDVEGVSTDIGPATLESLIAVVENLKSDSANVGTSTMQVDYSSTLSELAQVELDAILEGTAAPVDDLPIEIVPPSEAIVNKYDISDSQLPPDFSDAVVAAHQATKIPAKRTRTRSKVFMSPYTTEYASGSKAIEDLIGESKQKFAFDGFLISDNMPRGVIKEYKQWVEEGLLKFHVKKDCGVFVAGYAEYLSEGMNVPSNGFEAEYHRIRYATLLRKYGIQKAQKDYVTENDDPPRPRSRNIRIPGENKIVSIE